MSEEIFVSNEKKIFYSRKKNISGNAADISSSRNSTVIIFGKVETQICFTFGDESGGDFIFTRITSYVWPPPNVKQIRASALKLFNRVRNSSQFYQNFIILYIEPVKI